MTQKHILTQEDLFAASLNVAAKIKQHVGAKNNGGYIKLYGWPRGGVPASYLVASQLKDLGFRPVLVNHPAAADYIIDDLVDSGATKKRVEIAFPQAAFLALFDKPVKWLVFPWEETADGGDESATDIVTRMFQHIGEEPSRDGLLETPARVIKAWDTWFGGYGKKPADIFTTFDAVHDVQDAVTVQNIPFWSHCEHHIAPFFGVVHVSYVPGERIVGLSKFKRLIDIFARRLQVQERMTAQVADAINEHLEPRGVAVMVKARHSCMESRGVSTQGSETTTVALRGAYMDDQKAREEFMLTVGR